MSRKYLTTSQAAGICNVTRFTIRNWINSGKLKSTKTAGGHRRISKDALAVFMKSNQIVEIEKRENKQKQKKEVVVPARLKDPVKSKGFLHRGLYQTGKCVALFKKIIPQKQTFAHETN